MSTTDLERLSTAELENLLEELFDGNAGIILNGFREMGLKTDAQLRAAIIRYIIRKQA